MILCLDVGNTQIYGGLFEGDKMVFSFRKSSKTGSSSDEYGLFLRSVLKENGIDPHSIHHISICSVVPEVLHSLKNACLKYFKLTPFFLQAGVKTGLKIKYRNPLEVGADRIANAIAATHQFPNQNLIIIDFGTATTFCAISKDHDYLGGTIIPGLRIAMSSLESNTSKLPSVEILEAPQALGRSTIESIQNGLYFGTLGAVREICADIRQNTLGNEPTTVIGTGGFAGLFKKRNIFDAEVPDLVHQGLLLALQMNL